MKNPSPADMKKLLSDDSMPAVERASQLLPLVYDELRQIAHRRMAAERAGHQLQTTALVHEAYLRLVGDGESGEPSWRSRGHFFGAAAEAMRRILVEQARRRDRQKRGGDRCRVDLDRAEIATDLRAGERTVDLLALDEALVKLETEDARKATLVKLRYFAGVTLDQAAAALEISPATADRDWASAKAFLYDEVCRQRES